MIELLQFRHSPYNEKVRWALDLKRVPHRRRSLLPGPHVATLRRLTGRTHTPVIVAEGQAIDGSARILEWIEARWPQPALFPADATDRAEALRIQHWFDEDLTPRIRRAVLDALLRQPTRLCRRLRRRPAGRCSVWPMPSPCRWPRRWCARATASPVRPASRMACARRSRRWTSSPSAPAPTAILVGGRFGLADLTAGSTLAVLAQPPDSPMAGPQPYGAAFAALLERFEAHPAVAWTRRLYARHRGASRDFDGPSEGSV